MGFINQLVFYYGSPPQSSRYGFQYELEVMVLRDLDDDWAETQPGWCPLIRCCVQLPNMVVTEFYGVYNV